jgi:hypothetical protein
MKAMYKMIDNWATIPDTPSGCENGRTHGVCVTSTGNVIVFHQAQDGLLTFDPDGKLISASGGDRWLGAHGLTRVVEDGAEYLWLTDQVSKEVAKVNLTGETVQTIAPPDHAAYADGGKYVPTWAAVNPANGEIWVADGYGSSLVHRYDQSGEYLETIDGTEGAGRFACPHGINFRQSTNGVELWIADRGNKRVVIYDGEGHYQRKSTLTHSPCGFDFLDNNVVIPELFTGVKVLDVHSLELITELGASDIIGPDERPEGWPNLAGTDLLRPDFLNSPHGACFAPNGDIYCVEWIVGGRISRFVKSTF